MWRDFSNDVENNAAICASELFCDEEFEIIGSRAGGGSVAYPVRLKTSGRLAWAKPASVGGNEKTAAHEKIVADVGYKLKFPIAPVLLSKQTKAHGLPEIVALSFATLKQGRPWNGVEATLADSHKTAIGRQLSAILSLHCWIDDHDHDWNEGNALFEGDAGGLGRTVFYDYGHALTHQWAPPAPAPVRDWTRRQGPYSHVQPPEIIHAIEQIEKLAVNDLEAIIKRIPSECLPPDLGSRLAAALDERRKQLRTLLQVGAP
jgi:hypothetical protein